MKRGILLAAAAAVLVAAGSVIAADGDNAEGRGAFAASLRLEAIFPAAGFDYMLAGRVSLGPIVKYDGGKFVAAAESRFYFLADYERPGLKPYFLAEGGYQTGSDPSGSSGGSGWNWAYSARDGADASAEEDAPFPYRFYAFAGPGVDLRARGIDFVPFMEIGPRREFRQGNEGIYLYWALGLRYTW
ncbi:MAG: hypothetical protein V3T41_11615 [bacterium]